MKSMILVMLSLSMASAAPIINIETDTLRFGSVSAGGNHSRYFRISNAGDGALIIDRADFGYETYSLISPALPDTILAGQRESYLVNFRPTDELSYNTIFTFYSNDPITPAATMPARGRGVRVFAPGEVIWSYQGIENVVSCVAAEDIDDDGYQDVVAESFDSGAQGNNLLCISGSGLGTGHLIWSARPVGGPSNSGGYGDQCLITIEDLNRNGSRDIILGTAWGSRSVFAIEGATGQTIWSYDTYQNPPSGWIYSVASIGDLNDDGVPEILAGAGSDANKGFCFIGASGVRRWSLAAADVIYSVCGLSDINDDGLPDAILGAGDNDDAIYCVSGASIDSATLIWAYHTGGSVQSVDRINDLNGDGFNDVIAGTWYNGHRVMALSGHSDNTVDVIWNVAVGNPVMKVVPCPDLNGDSLQDVLVASWSSYALALSGADGSEIWRNFAGDDVWAIHWSYDITGDSVADVVAGSFTGSTILINGSTGETVWDSPSNAKIFTVRPIPDVNGDGIPDIIAGQQMLNGVGGKIFLISGGTINPSDIDEDSPRTPGNLLLLSNYPNPFNSATTISFNLSQDGNMSLEIFNIMGQKMRSLYDGYQTAGPHKIIWDGKDGDSKEMATGIYFSVISIENRRTTNKMIILR